MKVKYIGDSFGAVSLTSNKTYACLGVKTIKGGKFLVIVDDSGESYLYDAKNPRPMDGSAQGGKWEIVKDDESGTLAKAINC